MQRKEFVTLTNMCMIYDDNVAVCGEWFLFDNGKKYDIDFTND